MKISSSTYSHDIILGRVELRLLYKVIDGPRLFIVLIDDVLHVVALLLVIGEHKVTEIFIRHIPVLLGLLMMGLLY